MSALAETLAALRRALAAQKVRWFVFGAQAIAVRATPRATQDIDVTVEVDRISRSWSGGSTAKDCAIDIRRSPTSS